MHTFNLGLQSDESESFKNLEELESSTVRTGGRKPSIPTFGPMPQSQAVIVTMKPSPQKARDLHVKSSRTPRSCPIQWHGCPSAVQSMFLPMLCRTRLGSSTSGSTGAGLESASANPLFTQQQLLWFSTFRLGVSPHSSMFSLIQASRL